MLTGALGLALCFVGGPAQAHKPSDSYLTLLERSGGIDLRWDLALRDLDHALRLDADGDGSLTWGEVQAAEARVGPYLQSRLQVTRGAAPCSPSQWSWAITQHSDGSYLVARTALACGADGPLEVRYGLFFDVDPLHRGILHAERDGAAQTYIFSTANRAVSLALGRQSPWAHFSRTVATGVDHIWSGIDHLLFLFALLLPAVLRRERHDWVGQTGLKPSLADVLRIVTAFTLAHSISLSLAAFGWVSLPSRFVESAIAASIVVAALNNLFPVLSTSRWTAAFCLGILHGFAFSTTLRDLALPTANRLVTLLGFNLGVELGQLCAVAVFVPLAFLLRNTVFYRRWVLIGGSLLTLVLALVWLTERSLKLKLMPF